MSEPMGPKGTSAPSETAAQQLWKRLEPLLAASRPAQAVLEASGVFGAMGVVLVVIGLIRLGFTGSRVLLALCIGAAAALPVVGAWRGMLLVRNLFKLPAELHAAGQLTSPLASKAESTLRAAPQVGLLRSAQLVRENIGAMKATDQILKTAPSFAAPSVVRTIRCGATCFVVFAGGLVIFLVGIFG